MAKQIAEIKLTNVSINCETHFKLPRQPVIDSSFYSNLGLLTHPN